MTSKERMLIAFKNQKPDMVPVAPDISNMIPAKLTGKPFWDIYLYQDPPLWRAYIEAVKYFKMDGWFTYGYINYKTTKDERRWSSEIVSQTKERIVQRVICKTPKGDLWTETIYYIADPPTTTRKWIKDLKSDLPKLKYFFPEIKGYDRGPLEEQRKALGDLGVLGAGVGVPGMHDLFGWFDGGLEAAAEAYYCHYDLLKEFVSWQERDILRCAELILDAKPDFFMIGASGLWTMSSPEIFRDLSLPSLKRVTKMSKEAGIPSFLHACGKNRELVEICVRETDLDVMNPLEPPPMGDVDLGEVKEKFGDKIALMGNIHTTEVMLRGTEEDVERMAKWCIDVAGKNGGFVLSTGDQCGRDTPFENIFKLVEVARSYGKY